MLASVATVSDDLKDLATCTILLTSVETRIDAAMMDRAPYLKIIAIPATGTDTIDEQAASTRTIEVVSLKGETEFLSGITSTAELAFSLILSLLRKTHAAADAVKRYEWDREAFRGVSLHGKTLGVIGLGRLGTMMARYAQCFGMRTIAFDPKPKDTLDKCLLLPLLDVLSQSDILSLHVPLNEETDGMINAKTLGMMKLGAYLINTSRGKIVDEKVVLTMLKKNHLAGYATDVLTDELFLSPEKKHPLIEYAKTHANVIITPHIGGMTVEAREKTDMFIAQAILSALKS